MPSEHGPAIFGEHGSEDFVRADDVLEVLLGGSGELGVVGLPLGNYDYFAWCPDLPGSPGASRVSRFEESITSREPAPDPVLVHPAFEVLPAVKRATPPQPRMVADFEATDRKSVV